MNINEWLFSRYSKTKIAFFSIFIGILIILYFNPVYDTCDAQEEVFIEVQKNFIHLGDPSLSTKSSKWKKLMNYCRSTNTPGGCYELFSKSKRFIDDLKKNSLRCVSRLKGAQELKTFLFNLAELMVLLAWNESASQYKNEKFSWLKKEELYLFCQLKESIKTYYPKFWKNFELSLLKVFPNAQKKSTEELYQLSLFSYSCSSIS